MIACVNGNYSVFKVHRRKRIKVLMCKDAARMHLSPDGGHIVIMKSPEELLCFVEVAGDASSPARLVLITL